MFLKGHLKLTLFGDRTIQINIRSLEREKNLNLQDHSLTRI
jgi:hypothetical protein